MNLEKKGDRLMKREVNIREKLNFFYIFLENGAKIKAFSASSKNFQRSKEMAEHLEKVRWTDCIFANDCIDAVARKNFFGFSCEDCSLRGKPEFSIRE